MISKTTQRFRERLARLPKEIQQQAANSYRLFRENPDHPSLSFKKIPPHKAVYSVRINIKYRAVGVVDGDTIVWFWVGVHAEYEELLKHL